MNRWTLCVVAVLFTARPAFAISASYSVLPPPYTAADMTGVKYPVILPDGGQVFFSETYIAAQGSQVYVSFNDVDTPRLANYCAVHASHDGGKTFPDHTTIWDIGMTAGSPLSLTGDPYNDGQASDPWLATDSTGRIYFSGVWFPPGGAVDCSAWNYHVVTSSTDNGRTWGPLNAVVGWTGRFRDRPVIEADQDTPGVIWALSNTYNTPECQTDGEEGVPEMARSDDYGATWERAVWPATVHQPALNFVVRNGSALVASMLGDHVEVDHCTVVPDFCRPGPCPDPWGITCAPLATTSPAHPVTDDQWNFPDAGTAQRVNSMPVMACNTKGARCFAAWLDYQTSVGGQIVVSSSFDNGTTWSTPHAAYPASDEQFFPATRWGDGPPTLCFYNRPMTGVRNYSETCAFGKVVGSSIVWPAPAKWFTVGDIIQMPNGPAGEFIGDYISPEIPADSLLALVDIHWPNFFTGAGAQPFIELAGFPGGCAIDPHPAASTWTIVILIIPLAAVVVRRSGGKLMFTLLLLFAATSVHAQTVPNFCREQNANLCATRTPATVPDFCRVGREELCASPSPTPTRTPRPRTLDGDCNGDGCVEVNEIIIGVIAELNGEDPSDVCSAYNCNSGLGVHIDCLIGAVYNALLECRK